MSYISFQDVHKVYQMGEVTIDAVDGVTFVAREIPDAEFDCVCVVADWVRDTVVAVSRRVAARAAASDESSAYASHTNMPSIPRQHNKNRLIPVIPLLYM